MALCSAIPPMGRGISAERSVTSRKWCRCATLPAAAAVAALPVRSFLLDGDAIACDESGGRAVRAPGNVR